MSNSTKNTRCRDVSADLAESELLLGVSPWATAMRSQILRIAPHACNVLITGPTGTGKELIAQAICRHSPRCGRPFIPVDCAAVNGTLFASHMFGHVKGAFTGADNAALGCFRAADGGTIFLDEIGELELEFQAKLLRVLQGRAVTPLGSHEQIPVDIRLIAATNRDLPSMVAAGQFREDLYFRLNVVALETIPLKDRAEDIPVLAEHILARLAARNATARKQISPRCLGCLREHDWLGNVRELENYLERASLLAADEICFQTVAPVSLSSRSTPCQPLDQSLSQDAAAVLPKPPKMTASSSKSADIPDSWPTLSEWEREHIGRTLHRAHHNQTMAAELLGIPRQQLARKIKKHRLETMKAAPGRPSKSE
jgi:DNA-binding NtrC family response regulator